MAVELSYNSDKPLIHLCKELGLSGSLLYKWSKDMGNESKTPDNAIFHSDRGSQYSSKEVRDLIAQLGLKQSMSRKGNCWGNAVAESFFKTLKYDGNIKKVFNTK